MNTSDFKTTLLVERTPGEVFDTINDVSKWWTEDLEGRSKKLNDEFTVHFEDIHVTTQKLVELIPDQKVLWLVTDSKLNFVEDKHEWTNTKISFEISRQGGKTKIDFTHFGLIPEFQCYNSCVKGWDYFINGSLFRLLTEGKGTPGMMR